MGLRRFLGVPDSQPGETSEQPGPTAGAGAETATIRRIVAELEALPAERRRYLAGLAYVLGRAPHAGLDMSAAERSLIEQVVAEIGGLPQPQAVLVVEIARHQAQMYGGTEDYVVTREFAASSTDEQRIHAVEACFAVV